MNLSGDTCGFTRKVCSCTESHKKRPGTQNIMELGARHIKEASPPQLCQEVRAVENLHLVT